MLNSTDPSKYTLQSVDNALRIIELLGERRELTVTGVAQALGLGKSTAFRLLSTLEGRGFVDKSDASRYRLGMKFSYYGALVLSRLDIIGVVRPFLEELTVKTQETSHLVIWDEGNSVRFVDKVESPSTISMQSFVGLLKECHTTATGKALLAEKDDAYINDFLQSTPLTANTSRTITDPERLWQELRAIREQGYCVSCDEDEMGLSCVAAPVRDSEGRAIAAISISGPSGRMRLPNPYLQEIVVDTARKINNRLR